MTTNWIDEMEKEATRGGMFLKMQPTDRKTIEILDDPEITENEFQGQKRTEFRFKVRDLSNGETLIWGIVQKEVESQLMAIIKSKGLTTLKGQRLELLTSGPDSRSKHWFIRPLEGFGIPSQ